MLWLKFQVPRITTIWSCCLYNQWRTVATQDQTSTHSYVHSRYSATSPETRCSRFYRFPLNALKHNLAQTNVFQIKQVYCPTSLDSLLWSLFECETFVLVQSSQWYILSSKWLCLCHRTDEESNLFVKKSVYRFQRSYYFRDTLASTKWHWTIITVWMYVVVVL